MTLILGDGFDHYPTNKLLSKWDGSFGDPTGAFPQVTGGGGISIDTLFGRLGSQGIKIAGGSPGLTKNLLAPISTYGFAGVALFVPSYSVGGFRRELFGFYDPPTGGSQAAIKLMLENDGSLSLRTGDFNGGYSAPIDTTLPGRIVAGTWAYIEIKAKIHNTLGEIQVRINESVVNWIGAGAASFTGNTRRNGTNNYFTTIGLGGGAGTTTEGWGQAYYDDFYLCDDQGAINNSYLGDVQLQAIYPNGVGNLTQWTIDGSAPAPTNWEGVDETAPDDAVTFNKSNIVGNTDMYQMQDISATASGVKGLLMNYRIMKDDATARQYSPMVKDVLSGGVNVAVATRTTPFGAYTNQQDVSQVSPQTGVLWTVAQVNAMEAGIKVVS